MSPFSWWVPRHVQRAVQCYEVVFSPHDIDIRNATAVSTLRIEVGIGDKKLRPKRRELSLFFYHYMFLWIAQYY